MRISILTPTRNRPNNCERFIKSTFTVTSKAYLLPEYLNSVITNKVSNMKKFTTVSKVSFGMEGDATDEQVGK